MSFEEAVAYVKNSKHNPNITDDDRLEFYKYYKQATLGDCTDPMPSMFAFSDRAKWQAWNSVKGMSQDEARAMYVQMVRAFQ